MSSFSYRAVSADGKPVQGKADAPSSYELVQKLRGEGLQVNSVTPAARRLGLPRLDKELDAGELDAFNRQMVEILKSGLPIPNALGALAKDMRSRRLRQVMESVQRRMEQGWSFDQAVEDQRDAFSPVYLAIVRAGERTGNLPGVFVTLADYSGRSLGLRQSFAAALAYPFLVFLAAVIVMLYFAVYVIPEFAQIFAAFGARLPGPTQAIIDASDAVRHNPVAIAVFLFLGLVFGGYIARRVFTTETSGQFWDSLKLRAGSYGAYYKVLSTARFSRALGLLLASRIPAPEALSLAADTSGNAVLSGAVSKALRRVEDGETISGALRGSGFFHNSYCWLIGTAEERGEIVEALLSTSDAYEKNGEQVYATTALLVGHAILLLVGLGVGFSVAAMYLPLVTIADAIM